MHWLTPAQPIKKTCTEYLLNYRKTSGSLENEKCKPQASASTVFSIHLYKNTDNMFSMISFRKHRDKRKEKQLVNVDYQRADSLCSRHYYVNSASRSICDFNQSKRVIS